jgi:hypothetical protein
MLDWNVGDRCLQRENESATIEEDSCRIDADDVRQVSELLRTRCSLAVVLDAYERVFKTAATTPSQSATASTARHGSLVTDQSVGARLGVGAAGPAATARRDLGASGTEWPKQALYEWHPDPWRSAAGESEEDRYGSIESHGVVVTQSSDPILEFRSRHRCDLVDHQTARISQSIESTGESRALRSGR